MWCLFTRTLVPILIVFTVELSPFTTVLSLSLSFSLSLSLSLSLSPAHSLSLSLSLPAVFR